MKNTKYLLSSLFLLIFLIGKSQKCGTPIDSTAFKTFKTTVSKHAFDDNKMNEIVQSLGTKCFSSEQVKSLLGILSFEEDKIKIAKKAFIRVSDPENYSVILSAFSFQTSKEEIRKYVADYLLNKK